MTKRITISVPDDVAEHLASLGERRVSAYMSEVVKADMARRQALTALDEVFDASGHRPTEDALRHARDMIEAGKDWRARRQATA